MRDRLPLCTVLGPARLATYNLSAASRAFAVCLPVFFQPPGSVSQLMFGLVICFITFGAYMLLNPYVDDADDRFAELCQVCE